ncbi:putative ABC transporter permease [Clostridium oryzae]|uniref:ABC-transporter type IV n=1 Tax=Clostridium oryzae TaxID=1450648 RepID=A0A1V4IQU9_9CLOT|nr:hypothetical protein [Clostridium oryzae]OPJ62392.1 hypothetical protein CLORY_17610 [Clostridium oryzae]
MKIRYIIYGLLGICLEVFWTGLASLISQNITMEGRTYVWMFFIYGLGVLLEPVHNRIRKLPVILRGGIYTILIFFIEYSTGLLLRIVIGKCPWDYSGNYYSINGLITLTFIPVWFLAGLLFERVHDLLMEVHIVKETP